MATTHFESVSHRKDGSFALASSSLTGRTWDGSLWVFGSLDDYTQCTVLNNVAAKTASGISDTLWLAGENDLLVASDSGELEVWNCHAPGYTLEYKCSLGSHDNMVLTLSKTADHDRVISGGADCKVILWDANNKREVKSYKGHTDLVYSVTGHPTNRDCFMSTSKDGHIRLWDLRKANPASDFKARNSDVYTCLLWSQSDENSLALGSRSGSIEIVDMRCTQGCLFAHYSAHQRQVHRMAFAPLDCSLLASVSDDTDVRVLYTKNGNTIYSSSGHVDFVHGVSWHPTELSLLTCAWDGQVIQHSVDPSKKEEVQSHMLTSDTNIESPKDSFEKPSQTSSQPMES